MPIMTFEQHRRAIELRDNLNAELRKNNPEKYNDTDEN